MACPDCGYLMTAFDKDCPRCQKYKRSERSCPHCGTVNATDVPACKRCGHSFQGRTPLSPVSRTEQPLAEKLPPLRVMRDPPDAPSPSQMPQQAAASSVPASGPPLTAEALACRMCGNTNGQKLTAICRAGSWTTQSRGYAVGMGTDGYGHSVMVGGPTASSTFGQTALASLLLPPSRPVYQPLWVASVLIPVIGFLGSLIAFSAGPVAATVGVLLTCGLWVLALLTEGRAVAEGRAKHDAASANWEQAMQVWNRLFYCSRCDHVYDPQAGTAAVPHAMNTLLLTRGAAVRPLTPDDGAFVKAASLAFGVAALLLVGIWSLNASQQHDAQEEAQQVAALRKPLDAQFAAALPDVNAAITAGERAATVSVASDDYARSEKLSQLSEDVNTLKWHRDNAQQDLDALSKPDDFAALQEEASEAGTEIAGMQTSREAVTSDLQAFNQLPATTAAVASPSDTPVSPPDTDQSPPTAPVAQPGSRYSITTQAGGGQPPPLSSLPH